MNKVEEDKIHSRVRINSGKLSWLTKGEQMGLKGRGSNVMRG